MHNVIAIDTNAPELDAIVARIADRASKTVENVWHIGADLNTAKGLFSDDQSFGRWRRENITMPLGIADRTQQTFMRIARNWKLEDLPRFLGITALADVASLPEVQQREALEYLTSAAEDGKRVAVSTATSVVKYAREGSSAAEILQRIPPAAIPETEEVAPIAPVQRERPAAPVVIEGEVEVEGAREGGPVVPAPVGRVEDGASPDVAWAKRVVGQLRQQRNGHRRDYLGALMMELQAAKLLQREDGVTIALDGKGEKARIVARVEA